MTSKRELRTKAETVILGDAVAKLMNLGLLPDEICIAFTKMSILVKQHQTIKQVNDLINSMNKAAINE